MVEQSVASEGVPVFFIVIVVVFAFVDCLSHPDCKCLRDFYRLCLKFMAFYRR